MKTERNKAIVLVGMPGSGKSTAGMALAEKIGCNFVDTDELIVQKDGRKITEIFSQDGEKFFRELETSVIKEIKPCRQVISTGGGAVLNPYNMELLKSVGVVFYLEISPEKIYERIKTETTRPLLLKPDPLAELKITYNKRKLFYEKADYTINADDTIENITDKVVEIYEEVEG